MVRKTVDRLVEGGTAVNMCAIDLTKAFDKVTHSALHLKLMKRNISFGIRQGSMLSPFLFDMYIDDITKLLNSRLNCICHFVC